MSAPAITVCLGIDQAARSGWGIARPGAVTALLAHGVAHNHEERKAVIALALRHAGCEPRQLLVMFEDHGKFPVNYRARFDPRTGKGPERDPVEVATALGEARGLWKAVLLDVGHPESLRDAIPPWVWRKRVLGTARGTTDQLKHLACTWATMLLGEPIDDGDEAEGIAITTFAAVDGVARLAQRRAQQRADYRSRRDQKRQLELGAKEELR